MGRALARELAALAAGSQPLWAMPVTMSSEERTLALAERPLGAATGRS